MFEISDEIGNKFLVEDKKLACRIVNEKSNPFVNMVEYKKNAPKGEIVKTYADFCVYFY